MHQQNEIISQLEKELASTKVESYDTLMGMSRQLKVSNNRLQQAANIIGEVGRIVGVPTQELMQPGKLEQLIQQLVEQAVPPDEQT